MCEKMQRAFEENFPSNIQFPKSSYLTRSPGAIKVGRWTVTYIFGEESRREFIEFYSVNPFAGDFRARVFTDGTSEESDDVIKDVRQPRDERRRIEQELKALRLWPYSYD